MPDSDNIARKHPRGWGRCLDAASRGPDILAQYVHHLTAREINRNPNIKEATSLLRELVSQLQNISTLAPQRPFVAQLKLPKAAESTREKLMAVQAANRVLVELKLKGSMSAQEIQERAFKEFCLEIARAYAFGPLYTRGVPFPYNDVEAAHIAIKSCEERLGEIVMRTALELSNNPECKVGPVKAPKLPKKSQDELVQEKIEVRV